MLKRIKKFLKKKSPRSNAPHVIQARHHGIEPGDISHGALNVVEGLTKAGYEAYVVGGCVRDLLLDLHPKDFDVATNATPEQVRSIFRRARIVGRRFQIVHVHQGREMIEVTTFRAHHDGEHSKSSKRSQTSRQGMLLRDNIFGDIDQDAARRDFTVNALYYHPQDNTVYDYADGLPDLEQRILRMIGEPEQRYREDPVRMLRAVRFAAKLGFEIEPATAEPIQRLAKLLRDVAPARLFDEVIKLLMSGQGLASYHLLRQYGLFRYLFPATDSLLDNGDERLHNFIEQALTNTDQRIRIGKRVTPAYIYAAMLWPVVQEYSARNRHNNESSTYAQQHAAAQAIEQQLQYIAIPRRFTTPMKEIWDLQDRLPRRAGKRAERLLEHPRFRAAYDFVLMREESGEDLSGLGNWWTLFQEAGEEKRRTMVQALNDGDRKPRRRRRKPRKHNGGES
ncbi:polynucleotide adenylyltransferase PcnB [Porticoccaceae bacterium LTM1]|nr:polynucleotide adenylyltransferase PcnB [Porticoccaceae bacterium LTM1]